MTADVQVRDSTHLDEFDAAYMLGYGCGLDIGWFRGRDENDRAWQLIFTGYADAIARSRQVVPQVPPDRPCSLRCTRCAVCTRYVAAFRNQRTFGTPDFPGGRVGKW